VAADLNIIYGEKRRRVMSAIYVVVMFFLYQSHSLGTPFCFDDCVGYITLMGKSGGDYIGTLAHMFRPWSVPVFYSLFGQYNLVHASAIILAQTYLAYLSWMIFAASFLFALQHPLSKAAAFITLSMMMFGQGYYHFNQRLLSDSVALSAVLLQLSACLYAVRWLQIADGGKPAGRLISYLILGVIALFSAIEIGTRDSNIALAFFGLFIMVTCIENLHLSMRRKAALTAFIVLLAFLQSVPASWRHTLNATNILAGVVLPDEGIRTYFVRHGMPNELALAGREMKRQDLGDVNYPDLQKSGDIIRSLAPSFIGRSDRIYGAYLLSHPGYIINNTIKYRTMIFGQEYAVGSGLGTNPAFIKPVQGELAPVIVPGDLKLSPMDYIPLSIGALLACLYVGYVAAFKRTALAALPIVVVAAGVSNAILGFFGDLWQPSEMERHAFIGSVLFRVGIALAILFLFDAILGADAYLVVGRIKRALRITAAGGEGTV
jgi:hypothetical protein